MPRKNAGLNYIGSYAGACRRAPPLMLLFVFREKGLKVVYIEENETAPRIKIPVIPIIMDHLRATLLIKYVL